MIAIETVFWVAIGVIVYTTVAYPLLTLALAAIVRKRVDKSPVTPTVSLIIAAYNEERVIEQKIRQTLDLDYPHDKLEIIVASDGSTDQTDDIVRSFADRGVKLYRSEGRLGKTGTLNGAVASATGEIIIFSDATGIYNRQAIRELVSNFADPTVGCVTGRVTYAYGTDATSKGFKGYQRIAVAIRRAETLFGSQTSVSGSIHAMRRELYRPPDPAHSIDVMNAVSTVADGYRVVYENAATSQEESRTRPKDEYRCRVRNSVQATGAIPSIVRQLLRKRRLGYLFQMISHKILRWWLWCPMLFALAANILLVGHAPVYKVLAVVQVVVYAVGGFGLLAAYKGLQIPLASTLAFFLLGNVATGVGAIKAVAGRKMGAWQPVR